MNKKKFQYRKDEVKNRADGRTDERTNGRTKKIHQSISKSPLAIYNHRNDDKNCQYKQRDHQDEILIIRFTLRAIMSGRTRGIRLPSSPRAKHGSGTLRALGGRGQVGPD